MDKKAGIVYSKNECKYIYPVFIYKKTVIYNLFIIHTTDLLLLYIYLFVFYLVLISCCINIYVVINYINYIFYIFYLIKFYFMIV